MSRRAHNPALVALWHGLPGARDEALYAIGQAFEKYGGHLAPAAAELSVSEGTLRNWMVADERLAEILRGARLRDLLKDGRAMAQPMAPPGPGRARR